MARTDILNDAEAIKAIAEIFSASELDEIIERLNDSGNDFFATTVSALATEAMFSPDRAKETAAMTESELLAHPTILDEMSFALTLDESIQKEIVEFLSRNSLAAQKIFDRAKDIRTEITKKLVLKDDSLLNLIILRLAAIMLANVEHIDSDWDKIIIPGDDKKMPN